MLKIMRTASSCELSNYWARHSFNLCPVLVGLSLASAVMVSLEKLARVPCMNNHYAHEERGLGGFVGSRN
jgi:hypothetical protein